MNQSEIADDRFLVITYMARDQGDRRYRLVGPVLVTTRDYLHFYLTGTTLRIDAIGYNVIRDYPVGTTEQQATEFFIYGFNELERIAMALAA